MNCAKQPCDRPAQRRGMCGTHYEQYRTRQQAYGRWESVYVDAEPARLHAKELQATGMGARRIAELAGTSRNNINCLIHGRPDRGTGPSKKIHKDWANKLLAIPLPEVPHHLAAPRQVVPAIGTARRLQALMAIGYTQAFLSKAIGFAPTNGCRLFHPERQNSVQAATARRVENLFNRLQLTPGPSTRARRFAQRNNWAPPLAWDEDTIDNPDARPDRGGANPAGFVERYRELRDELGQSDINIAARLGIQLGSLERQLIRHGLTVSAELRSLAHRERARKAS